MRRVTAIECEVLSRQAGRQFRESGETFHSFLAILILGHQRWRLPLPPFAQDRTPEATIMNGLAARTVFVLAPDMPGQFGYFARAYHLGMLPQGYIEHGGPAAPVACNIDDANCLRGRHTNPFSLEEDILAHRSEDGNRFFGKRDAQIQKVTYRHRIALVRILMLDVPL